MLEYLDVVEKILKANVELEEGEPREKLVLFSSFSREHIRSEFLFIIL